MSESPSPLSLEARAAWSVALYELRRLLRARHAAVRIGVVMLPVLMAALVAAVQVAFAKNAFHDPLQTLGQSFDSAGQSRSLAFMFRIANLRWVFYLAAAFLFGGLFSGERSERTLHHAFLQPVRRETLAVGKYLAGVMLLWPLGVIAWILTTVAWMLPLGPGAVATQLLSLRGLGDLLAYAAVLLLACVAYGGVFLMAGAFVRSPPLVAVALLAWEGTCAFLPLAFQRFTVFYWLDSLLPVRVPAVSALAVLADAAPWPVSVLVAFGIGAAGVAAAAWRARGMELAYGASE